MKFLCDRCKTRYSIGDDRVRGKILKIRCKTCSHVITVREGMPNPDAEAGPPPDAQGMPRRVHKTTTMAPAIQSEAPAPPVAAAAKPPAALDDEWYVSIDGEQSGPFSLADAQRWVAGHPLDADLHCWNEGFDDWLPIDKVSHFRGLRKKPVTAALAPVVPPVVPAPARAPAPVVPAPVVPAPARAPAPAAAPAMAARAAAPAVPARPSRPPSEDEPKPLFAATMAQLEKGSGMSELRGLGGAPAPPAPVAASGLGAAVPPVPSPLRGLGGARPAATPPNGNGAPGAHGNGAALQAKVAGAAVPDPMDRPSRSGPIYAATQPGVGLKPQQPASANPFDASETDAATQMEAPAFDAAPTVEARKGLFDDLRPGRAAADAAASALAAIEPAPAPAPAPAALAGGDDDDLDIGEVSRVVKLADLAKSAPSGAATPARPQPAVAARPSASALSRTGAMPRLVAPKLGEAAPVPFGEGEPMALVGTAAEPAPPAAAASRRGMIALLVGALLLLGGAVAVVFLFVLADDEVQDRGLAKVDDVDTTRPDEVRRAGGTGSGSGGSAAGPTEPPPNPLDPRPKRPVTPPPVTPPPVTPPADGSGAGVKLDAREIEEMAAKNSSTTQRCYMRAQRGADGILTADVKKVAVTLTVGADGTVTDVQLSDKQEENSLGKCLIATIKSWKFRASPGGVFRISLHFG